MLKPEWPPVVPHRSTTQRRADMLTTAPPDESTRVAFRLHLAQAAAPQLAPMRARRGRIHCG